MAQIADSSLFYSAVLRNWVSQRAVGVLDEGQRDFEYLIKDFVTVYLGIMRKLCRIKQLSHL